MHSEPPRIIERSPAGQRIEQNLPRFSVAKVLRHLASEERLDGFEAEVESEYGGHRGTGGLVGATTTIPWAALKPKQRALTAADPTGGGALVGMSVGPAADVLRPYSVAARTGMSVISGLQGNLLLPSVDDEVEFEWLGAETTMGPNLTPATGGAQLRVHVAIGLIKFSGRLMRMAPPQLVESFVRRRLMLAAGAAVDRAVLCGRSAGLPSDAASPLGLYATPGVQTYSVANAADLLAQAVNPAMTHVATQALTDDAASFVASPSLRQLLLPGALSDVGPIDSSGRLNGRPLHCTASMLPNVGAYGDWTNATLALFGEGIEISIDPYSGFKTESIAMRCFVAMDVAFPNPGAFALIKKT